MNTTLDYRRKELDQPSFRIISDPPIADVYFTLRAFFVFACFYLVFVPIKCFTSLGCIWFIGGETFMLLDLRYADRFTPTNGGPDLTPIASILQSSNSWPYATWITIPGWLQLAMFVLAMACFWYVTRYRRQSSASL